MTVADFSMKLLVVALLFFGLRTAANAHSDLPAVPFVRYDDLKSLLGGTFLDVWDARWPETSRAVYDDSLRKIVERDLADLERQYKEFKPLGAKPELVSVKINPKNHLLYLLFEPTSDLVMDANIVYIYNPGLKRFVCKTTVSLGQ